MKLTRYILLFFLFGFSFKANATHIVGGELVYKCLGNFTYEIKLKVYRDCYNGIPLFDDPARLNVFDINGTRLDAIQLSRPPWDTLPINIVDPCFVVPPDVCVEGIVYIDTINLPYRDGGYFLSYSRCCRNYTIFNIEPEPKQGATYSCYIPMRNNQTECDNSNPYFNNFPPIGICANKPLIFDHSATDPDGDSLVYEVCIPYNGGTEFDPLDDNLVFNPVFPEIIWRSPYNENNMLGGVPLVINSRTGLLTAVPNRVGQFVVGICVKEYRNGQLLSVGRRDFQFNVVECQRHVVSSFFAPNYLCSTYSVNFDNMSTGNISNYSWDFGVSGTNTDVSNNPSPFYTYPDTGIYNVQLIVNDTSGCADTSYHNIHIVKNEITANINLQNRFCVDRNTIANVIDASTTGNRDPINQWDWYINNQHQINNDNILEIPILFDDTLSIKLVVKNDQNCIDSVVRPIIFSVNPDKIQLPDNEICNGERFQINLPQNPEYTYQWQPNIEISDPNIANPIIAPSATRTYTLRIQNIINSCTIYDTIFVDVNPKPNINIMPDLQTCNNIISLNASSNGDRFLWSNDSNFYTILNGNQNNSNVLTIQNIQHQMYYFKAYLGECFDTSSVRVTMNGIGLNANDIRLCKNANDTILIAESNQNFENTYQWYKNGNIIQGAINDTLNVSSNSASYFVIAHNNRGCIDTANASVSIFSNSFINVSADRTDIRSGELVQLNATRSPTYNYNWTPNYNINYTNIYNPIVHPDVTTTYLLTIRDQNLCINKDSITIKVSDNPCNESTIFVPNAFTPNDDGNHDVLVLKSLGVERLHFAIYDRNGEKIFETNSINDFWDGTYKGKKLSPDVYGYYAEYDCYGGKTFFKKGNITLLK